MIIKYSFILSKDHEYHVEREVDSADYDGLMRDFEAACDLRQLRHEKYLRDAANREAERRLEVLAPETFPMPPARDDGPHERVFEYDGAFQCLKCKKEWGALPGRPVMPIECRWERCQSRLGDSEIRCALTAGHPFHHENGDASGTAFTRWNGRACACLGEDPSHPSCFTGNDPVGKMKAAGEDRS